MRTTDAPSFKACWIVGNAAEMRWVFVMAPVFLSWGTLKSTRMRTRWPFTEMSLMDFFIAGDGLGASKK